MTELIFALDVPDRGEAARWVMLLSPEVQWFKIGIELFSHEGPALVRKIVDSGKKVFLDLKFHDIPRTVENAVLQAASTGASMMNVHASGGKAMMEAAAKAAKSVKNPPKIVAVTVLTSLDKTSLKNIGIRRAPKTWAPELAIAAKESGLDGVVASPLEIELIKKRCGKKFIVVTPGIRMPGSETHDQKRAATPAQAAKRGADFIVVGRPIREATDPIAVVREIKKMLKG